MKLKNEENQLINDNKNYYLDLALLQQEKNKLKESLKYCKLIRFIQVLGAYGFRGLIQKKAHFIASVDQGIKNLVDFAENEAEISQFHELKNLILKLNTEEVKNKIERIVNYKT